MNPLTDLKGMDPGRVLALIKKLGGREKVDAFLRDQEEEILVSILFDKSGHRIPKNSYLTWDIINYKGYRPDFKLKFELERPKLDNFIDYNNRIKRLSKYLSTDIGLNTKQFKEEVERLWYEIKHNPSIANISKGIGLPVILPQFKVNDIGKIIELCLDALGKSLNDYPERDPRISCLDNYLEDELAGREIVCTDRCKELIRQMKEKPVIGIYFPISLSKFSSDPVRKQIRDLPKEFVLSGIDMIIAMIMYPDILMRNRNDLVLNLHAFLPEFLLSVVHFHSTGKAIFDVKTPGDIPMYVHCSGLFFYHNV